MNRVTALFLTIILSIFLYSCGPESRTAETTPIQCTSNSQCLNGYSCINNSCVAINACQTHSDCNNGEADSLNKCVRGQCVAPITLSVNKSCEYFGYTANGNTCEGRNAENNDDIFILKSSLVDDAGRVTEAGAQADGLNNDVNGIRITSEFMQIAEARALLSRKAKSQRFYSRSRSYCCYRRKWS